jgi:hypothetical protein
MIAGSSNKLQALAMGLKDWVYDFEKKKKKKKQRWSL